jgi:glycosyltransferase 2 family protein
VDKWFRRTSLRLGAAAALSAIALWLASRNVRLDGLRSALAGASLSWLLAYPVICLILNVVRGEIWRRLLRNRVTTAEAFWAYSIGFLANNVMPFRIGEAVRVVVLAKRRELPVVEVLAAAGLERLLDMAALAMILAIVAPRVAHVPGLATGALIVVVVVASTVAAIGVLARFRNRPPAVIDWCLRLLPQRIARALADRWRDLARGLAVLLEPAIGIPCAAGALVVWTLTIVLQWLVLRAFQPNAGALDAAFMVAIISLAIALPAAPGFVGVYHWAGQQSLVAAFPQLYDPNTALAAATVAHAASYVTSTAIGLVGLWYFGMPISTIVDAARDRERIGIRDEDACVDRSASTDAV